ncbi:MAG: adenylate/guanylate cyclase domain-containing protein [Deltaproteobacteria bacterium]|nr:adenylate/guanylate cyclase domain-containing protein [Deltaproteobacteria bacterium]
MPGADSEGGITEFRLAAIVSGDVAGYSRLMAQDQAAAVHGINTAREVVTLLIDQHSGRLVDFTGDNFLAEFPSTLEAVRCAVEIQNVTKARNRGIPESEQLRFRMGVHQGDVRVEEGRLFGTGVNIAARLEALAETGGICISAPVYEQLRGTFEIDCEDLGEKTVKNIPNPVHVFRIGEGEEGEEEAGTRAAPLRWRRPLLAAAALLLIAAVGAAGWLAWQRAPTSEVDSPAATAVERASIVVLPFSNMSDDAKQEYFADGMTEDLTTELSRVPGLLVIARNSAFTYKGQAVNAKEVGAELGVRYLLEGSVRKAGDRVRITAQLIDTSSGFHMWSENYDRSMVDVFAVQSEITREIMNALEVKISEAELARIRRAPVENLSAYDLWMQGRAARYTFNRAAVVEARAQLQRALQLDPDFADAEMALGANYLAEFAGWNPNPELLRQAYFHLHRALEMSPMSPYAYVSLAGVQVASGRPQDAIVSATRALELAPGLFEAHSVLGVTQLQSGLIAESIQTLEDAVKLSPKALDFTWTLLGWAHYRAGHFDEAASLWERVRAVNPDAAGDRISLVNHYWRRGREDEAREIVAEILRSNPNYNADLAAVWLGATGLPAPVVGDFVAALMKAGVPPPTGGLMTDPRATSAQRP